MHFQLDIESFFSIPSNPAMKKKMQKYLPGHHLCMKVHSYPEQKLGILGLFVCFHLSPEGFNYVTQKLHKEQYLPNQCQRDCISTLFPVKPYGQMVSWQIFHRTAQCGQLIPMINDSIKNSFKQSIAGKDYYGILQHTRKLRIDAVYYYMLKPENMQQSSIRMRDVFFLSQVVLRANQLGTRHVLKPLPQQVGMGIDVPLRKDPWQSVS